MPDPWSEKPTLDLPSQASGVFWLISQPPPPTDLLLMVQKSKNHLGWEWNPVKNGDVYHHINWCRISEPSTVPPLPAEIAGRMSKAWFNHWFPFIFGRNLNPDFWGGVPLWGLVNWSQHLCSIDIHPRKLTWHQKIHHERRCIFLFKIGIFQPVMLVFSGFCFNTTKIHAWLQNSRGIPSLHFTKNQVFFDEV